MSPTGEQGRDLTQSPDPRRVCYRVRRPPAPCCPDQRDFRQRFNQLNRENEVLRGDLYLYVCQDTITNNAFELEFINGQKDYCGDIEAVKRYLSSHQIEFQDVSIFKKDDFFAYSPKDDLPNIPWGQVLVQLAIAIPWLVFEFIELIPSPTTMLGRYINFFLLGFALIFVGYFSGETIKKAYKEELSKKRLGINSLFVLGILVALIYSVCVLVLPDVFESLGGHAHFSAIFVIMAVFTIGQCIEAYLKTMVLKKGLNHLDPEKYLSQRQPTYVRRCSTSPIEQEEEDDKNSHPPVKITDIKEGDVFWVEYEREKGCARCAVDGVYLGKTPITLDLSSEFGESPCSGKEEYHHVVQPGEDPPYTIRAGTVILLKPDQKIRMRASADGKKSTQYQAALKLNDQRNPIPTLADKVSGFFVPAVLFSAAIAALFWFYWGPVNNLAYPLIVASAVLLCVCPCVFAFVNSISTAFSTEKLGNKGIDIRDARYVFESIRTIDCAVFDKTGTLTKATEMEATFSESISNDDLQQLYAAEYSEENRHHPIARAIMREMQNRVIERRRDVIIYSLKLAEGILSWSSKGNHLYEVKGFEIKDGAVGKENENVFYTYLDFFKNGASLGQITLKHHLQEAAAALITYLRKAGIACYMSTGDKNARVAHLVAQAVGIDEAHVYSGQNEDEKAALIKHLQQLGHEVMMVGDGDNDRKAKSLANIAIGMRDLEGDVMIKEGKLSKLLSFLNVSSAIDLNTRFNVILAISVSFLSVAFASGLLFLITGHMETPLIASIVMELSVLLVVMSSVIAYRHLRGKWIDSIEDPPGIEVSKEHDHGKNGHEHDGHGHGHGHSGSDPLSVTGHFRPPFLHHCSHPPGSCVHSGNPNRGETTHQPPNSVPPPSCHTR